MTNLISSNVNSTVSKLVDFMYTKLKAIGLVAGTKEGKREIDDLVYRSSV